MELKKGYKQTDAGVIPEDWASYTFGEAFEFLNTANNPWSDLSEYGDYKYIHYGDVHGNQSAFLDCAREDIPRIHKSEVQHLPLLEDGDLIIADASEDYEGTGISVEVKNIKGQRVVAGLHTLLLRGDKKLVADGYKGYIQSIAFIKQELIKIATGVSVYGISKSNLKRIAIPLPPLPEQRAIASALSDVDALIAALDALIAKKRLVKQGAMQELLTGKRRLPGFSEEWEIKKLGEIGKCLRGVSYKGDSDLSPSDTEKTTRLLRSNNVQNASVVFENLQFVNSQRVSDYQIMCDDDILICMANGSKELVGKAAAFHTKDHYKYTFGTFMGCFRLTSKDVSPLFVPHAFQTHQYRNYISNLIAGSSINNLKPSDIESIQFPFPEISEQIAIAEILADMDAEIAALETHREKTRLLKQGMMQELLTGRTRLV